MGCPHHAPLLVLKSSSTQSDVDIPSIDTTVVPTATHIQGPITRSRAKQLNYQVLSFLGTIPHIHENMILPQPDVFLTLRNNGPSMDERDKHWSMAMHGDGSKHVMYLCPITMLQAITRCSCHRRLALAVVVEGEDGG